MRARGLGEVVGFSTILSHFGIQDESHWQVLDYQEITQMELANQPPFSIAARNSHPQA